MLEFSLLLKKEDFMLDMEAQFLADKTVILGASGAGKSTLLRLIAGVNHADQGYIQLNDTLLFEHVKKINIPMHQRHVGLMWQEAFLFPHLTVQQNIEYGYRLIPPNRRQIDPKPLYDLLDIAALLPRMPRHLSGGEKQRVALCRTLVTSPKTLLLDEPLSALNPDLKKPILDFLDQVPHKFGIPLVYVTHQAEEANALHAEIWHCQSGQLTPQLK